MEGKWKSYHNESPREQFCQQQGASSFLPRNFFYYNCRARRGNNRPPAERGGLLPTPLQQWPSSSRGYPRSHLQLNGQANYFNQSRRDCGSTHYLARPSIDPHHSSRVKTHIRQSDSNKNIISHEIPSLLDIVPYTYALKDAKETSLEGIDLVNHGSNLPTKCPVNGNSQNAAIHLIKNGSNSESRLIDEKRKLPEKTISNTSESISSLQTSQCTDKVIVNTSHFESQGTTKPRESSKESVSYCHVVISKCPVTFNRSESLISQTSFGSQAAVNLSESLRTQCFDTVNKNKNNNQHDNTSGKLCQGNSRSTSLTVTNSSTVSAPVDDAIDIKVATLSTKIVSDSSKTSYANNCSPSHILPSNVSLDPMADGVNESNAIDSCSDYIESVEKYVGNAFGVALHENDKFASEIGGDMNSAAFLESCVRRDGKTDSNLSCLLATARNYDPTISSYHSEARIVRASEKQVFVHVSNQAHHINEVNGDESYGFIDQTSAVANIKCKRHSITVPNKNAQENINCLKANTPPADELSFSISNSTRSVPDNTNMLNNDWTPLPSTQDSDDDVVIIKEVKAADNIKSPNLGNLMIDEGETSTALNLINLREGPNPLSLNGDKYEDVVDRRAYKRHNEVACLETSTSDLSNSSTVTTHIKNDGKIVVCIKRNINSPSCVSSDTKKDKSKLIKKLKKKLAEAKGRYDRWKNSALFYHKSYRQVKSALRTTKNTDIDCHVLENLLEAELTCVICYEPYYQATVLNCSHTFCSFCWNQWKKKKKRKSCPSCRANVSKEIKVPAIDNFIEKISELLGESFFQERSIQIASRRFN